MATDQVELSIQCPQHELVAYLKSKDILPQGYSPLGGTGKSNLRENDVVQKIADKYNVQTANILLSWLVMRGINPVPKSVTPERIANNLKRKSSVVSLKKLFADNNKKMYSCRSFPGRLQEARGSRRVSPSQEGLRPV